MAELKPAYLIHGDDHGALAARRAGLRALAEGGEGGGASVEVLEGDAATPDGYEPEDPSDDDPDGTGEEHLPIRYLGAASERGVDVDAVTEMVSVLDAQRAYEANASVFDIGKRLAERTIDMGRVQ